MTAIKYIERTVLIILLLAALSTSNARAGSYASRNIIGFSPDGRYFAFEEYGVHDAVDGAYATIFIIDSRDDSWVPGTPIVRSEIHGGVSPAQMRKEARRQAQRLLTKLRIKEPGDHLASNPLRELSAAPHRVVVNAAYHFEQKTDPVTFTLVEMPLTSSECTKFFDLPTKGFMLSFERAGMPSIVMHHDASLPESRGCPLAYAISDVMAMKSDGGTTYVVLIHVAIFGFENPDYRFIAVTRRLP